MPPLFSWDRLLGLIDDRKVVPVVGQDLLRVDVAGRSVLLYRYLAERLAEKLGVETPSADGANPLHQVATRHLEARGDWQDIYAALRDLDSEVRKLPVPEPLNKLAAVRSFQLFVTTTFDSLLRRALNDVRYGGDDVTNVLAFRSAQTDDVPEPMPAGGAATVFHLFGKVSGSAGDYAVTEDDTVEFMHVLQSKERRPEKLFRELVQRDILLLGSGFDDWLSRFFIRSIRQERLWFASTRSGFVADDRVRSDADLFHYLRQSPCVKIFTEGGPIEFVDQLHARWMERQSEIERERLASGGGYDDAEAIDGCVFISYATENRAAAEKIASALASVKIDVWFDQARLRSGDTFGPKIRTAIERSAAFVPVISASVDTGNRYFWEEWKKAMEVANRYGPADRYLLPIVVDETRYDDPRVPEELRRLTWERLTQDGPSEVWVQTVRQTVRKNRKQVLP